MSLTNRRFKALIELYELYLKYIRLKPTCIWVYEFYTAEERQSHGFFQNAYQIIKQKYSHEFRKVTRMSLPVFNLLLNLMKEKLEKTSIRRPIEPECRLVLTLMQVHFVL